MLIIHKTLLEVENKPFGCYVTEFQQLKNEPHCRDSFFKNLLSYVTQIIHLALFFFNSTLIFPSKNVSIDNITKMNAKSTN